MDECERFRPMGCRGASDIVRDPDPHLQRPALPPHWDLPLCVAESTLLLAFPPLLPRREPHPTIPYQRSTLRRMENPRVLPAPRTFAPIRRLLRQTAEFTLATRTTSGSRASASLLKDITTAPALPSTLHWPSPCPAPAKGVPFGLRPGPTRSSQRRPSHRGSAVGEACGPAAAPVSG